MKKYIYNIIFLLINSAFAVLSAFSSLLIDTSIIKGTSQTENAYMTMVLGTMMVYTYVYTYIKELVRFFINRNSNVSDKFNKVNNYIYCIISGLSLFIINRYRGLAVVGDALCIIVPVFNLILMNIKTNKINETYFFSELIGQKNKTDKEIYKKEVKKQINCVLMGTIFGILSAIVLLIVRFGIFEFTASKFGDGEMGIFFSIIGCIALLIGYDYIFDSINEKYCKKKHNKQVECYWIIQDIGVYSFIFFSAVSYMIVLVKIINMNIALSIFIVWVAKILNKHRLSLGSDPDFKPFNLYGSYDPAETLAEYRENERRREERKKDWGFSTATRYDKYGNYDGSVTTYNVGGVEFTDVKDRNGKVEGSATSFEFGGVKHTTYKKR